jgi:flagellar secretion chaperone FliS
MNTHDSAFAYHQSTALGASPVGQVLALYDTILRDSHRTIAAIDAGQIEKRVNMTNHALVVIGELQGVLDFDRGGEAARNLSNFYNVARSMILEASITNSREKLVEVIAMFMRLRSAWSQVERKLGPSEPTREFRVCSEAPAAVLQNEPVAPEKPKGSGNRIWNG